MGSSAHIFHLACRTTLGPVHYDQTSPTATTSTSIAFSALRSFVLTAGPANVGTIKVQFSNDGGTTWLYHNGTSWTSGSGYAQASSLPLSSSVVQSFPVGSGQFRYRAFLNSANGGQATEITDTTVSYIP